MQKRWRKRGDGDETCCCGRVWGWFVYSRRSPQQNMTVSTNMGFVVVLFLFQDWISWTTLSFWIERSRLLDKGKKKSLRTEWCRLTSPYCFTRRWLGSFEFGSVRVGKTRQDDLIQQRVGATCYETINAWTSFEQNCFIFFYPTWEILTSI